MADEIRTTIQPMKHDAVPYEEWQQALHQISAALRQHGLILVTNILDGSFSVERENAE